MSKKLLQFEVEANGENKELVFYGDYQKEQLDVFGADHAFDTIIADEDSLRLMEIVDGKEVPFEVTGETWAGYRYDAMDAFQITWTSLTQAAVVDAPYQFSYVDPGIQAVADSYRQDQVEDLSGDTIQKYILYREPEQIYEIGIATGNDLFYVNTQEEGVVDIGRGDRSIYSDNYFAENEYFGLLHDEDSQVPVLYLGDQETNVLKEQQEKAKVQKKEKSVSTKKQSVLAKLHEKQEKLHADSKKAPQKKHEQEI